MEKLIDLHIHSKFSDGTMTPSEIVSYAKEKGLAAIALTDHDTVDGLEEVICAGQRMDIEIIPGIEISAQYDDLEVHILGLYIDYKNSSLIGLLELLRRDREKRNERLIAILNKLGFEISMEEVKEYANGDMIAKGHIIGVMINKGYVKNGREAREKYFYDGGLAHIKKSSVELHEAVTIIKSAGGIPILAHPGEFRIPREEITKLILNVKNEGIEGIEAYYYAYDDEMTGFLIEIAEKNDLLISGGSDFHGIFQPQTDMGIGDGNLKIPYDVLENIKQKVGRI